MPWVLGLGVRASRRGGGCCHADAWSTNAKGLAWLALCNPPLALALLGSHGLLLLLLHHLLLLSLLLLLLRLLLRLELLLLAHLLLVDTRHNTPSVHASRGIGRGLELCGRGLSARRGGIPLHLLTRRGGIPKASAWLPISSIGVGAHALKTATSRRLHLLHGHGHGNGHEGCISESRIEAHEHAQQHRVGLWGKIE